MWFWSTSIRNLVGGSTCRTLQVHPCTSTSITGGSMQRISGHWELRTENAINARLDSSMAVSGPKGALVSYTLTSFAADISVLLTDFVLFDS